MSLYIIKRLLIMVPTFFAISLMVFVIINVVPGSPSHQASSEDAEGSSLGSAENWRVFKSQFNLDKPVLFNTRFLIDESEVERAFGVVLNRNEEFDIKQRREAMEWIDDLGYHAISHMLQIAAKEKDPAARALAIGLLCQNAKRDVRYDYGNEMSDALQIYNEQVRQENLKLDAMVIGRDASQEEYKRTLAAWQEWFDVVRGDRFELSTLQKAEIFFFETRFARYWSNLLRFDFGVSHIDKRPVIEKVIEKLKYSLTLAIPAVFLAYVISIFLGAISALKRGSALDKTISYVTFALYSAPSFFVATLLLVFFSTGSDYFHWFPTGGWQSADSDYFTTLGKVGDVVWHLLLPVFCLTYGSLAILSRYVRTGLVDVLGADYIRTARAKGVPEFQVITKHALRNGIIPIITLLGTVLPALIGGSVVIEVIFGIPGMGLLTYDAILNRDYNTVLAVQLIVAVLVMVGILLSDILHACLDPRVSFK